MRSRARQLAAALLVAVAGLGSTAGPSAALDPIIILPPSTPGQSFTIRGASVQQIDVTGPAVDVRTQLCLRSRQPADSANHIRCRSEAADPSSTDFTRGDLQLFLAYMVTEGAVAPESFNADGALAGVTFTRDEQFAARIAEQPGQAGQYQKQWVAYRSTRIPAFTNVISPQDSVVTPRFTVPPTVDRFDVRIVHGWRFVSDTAGYEIDRPVVCGDPIAYDATQPIFFRHSNTTEADCGNDDSVGPVESNYFPQPAPAGAWDPTKWWSYPFASLPVASANVSAPLLGGAIDAGQATTLQFGFSSRAAPGAPPTVPVAAGTTIPGGVAVANTAALPLAAGAGTLLVEVFAPPGTPTGIYQVGVTVGTGTGLRSALAPISVTAVGQSGTPLFDNNTLLTGKQHAAQLRRLLDKKKVGERLRKKSKTTISYAHQQGVTVTLKLRTSGKRGRTVAQGTSRSAGGGLDKLTLKRTKYGSKKLRRGSRFKGRMIITLSGAQEDLVNEQISLRTKPKRKTSKKK